MSKRMLMLFAGIFLLRSVYGAPVFTDSFSAGAGKGELKNMAIKDGKAVLKVCNLVTNGSFEASDKGMPGFYLYDGTRGALDTTVAHDGKYSVRIDKETSLYNHEINLIPVREGVESYVVSMWVKTGFGPKPDENSVRMRVWGHNKEKKTYTQVIGAYITGTHDWTRLVQPIIPAKETVFITCDTGFLPKDLTETGCKVWLDGLQIEEGKRPTDFTEKYYREGSYTSPEINPASGAGKIAWIAESPAGTGVEARWRAANNTEGFEDAKWSEWSAVNPLSFTAKGMKLLQFQVRLLAKDRGLETPLLGSVSVE